MSVSSDTASARQGWSFPDGDGELCPPARMHWRTGASLALRQRRERHISGLTLPPTSLRLVRGMNAFNLLSPPCQPTVPWLLFSSFPFELFYIWGNGTSTIKPNQQLHTSAGWEGGGRSDWCWMRTAIFTGPQGRLSMTNGLLCPLFFECSLVSLETSLKNIVKDRVPVVVQ